MAVTIQLNNCFISTV